jgi:hypothetical protein
MAAVGALVKTPSTLYKRPSGTVWMRTGLLVCAAALPAARIRIPRKFLGTGDTLFSVQYRKKTE